MQNRAILFTLDITIGTSDLGTITWPSNLVNIPDDLPMAEGSRYLLTIIGFYDSVEQRYEVVGGSSSGGTTLWSDITIDTNKDMEMYDLYNLSLIQFDTDYDSKLRQIKGLHDVGMTFDLGATGAEVTDEYYYFKINGNEVIRFQNDYVYFTQGMLPQSTSVDIGNSTFPFSDVFALVYNIGGSPNNILQLDSDNNTIFVNLENNDYGWYISDAEVLSLTSNTLEGSTLEAYFQSVIIGYNLFLDNVGVDPVSNGMFALNGSDVKIYSGGAVRNISDIITNPLASNLNFEEFWAVNVNGIDFAGSSSSDPEGEADRFWIEVPLSFMTFNVPNADTDGYSFWWAGTEYLRFENVEIFPLLDFGINLGDSTHRFGGLQINSIDFYGPVNPHSGYLTGTLNMNDNVIENILKLEIEVGATVLGGEYSITVPASFMTFNVPSTLTDSFSFQWDAEEALRIQFGEIKPLLGMNLGDPSFYFGSSYIENMFFNDTITPVGGSAIFAGTLNMDYNDIEKVATLFPTQIEFVNNTTITDNAGGMVFNVPTGESYEWNVNNIPFLQLNYNYGSGPSLSLNLIGTYFSITTTETGNPLQIQKISGDPAEFTAVEGFQFDNSVFLEANLESRSPYNAGNFVDFQWAESFFYFDMIEDTDTNYGMVFELNNEPYLQIIHNSAQTYPDFLYAQTPLWLVADGTFAAGKQGFLMASILTTEPPTPPKGNYILYTIQTGPVSGNYTTSYVIKWSDGTKNVFEARTTTSPL